ncbi:DUF1501 domain-containing protein [Amantichitinum ursilacus]|uniref:Tat pathway signal sequence domain protein n=1 Tax=Amantichitinum ursilacus TaxID=857265 RepID=A0A0N0GLD1_9NEIS|nr:DUF1501 domain-containing protein [Amantichitinum ursilacus]KPC49874.1 hypothetical protein WG78_19050 [Amantichitinum ursilacus]
MNRRHFLKGAGSAGMLAALSQLSLNSAFADSASDYKALVIVFLYGGNDSNNMIIPYDASAYATYAGVRGALAIPQAQLTPLANPAAINANTMNGVQQFGLHPALAALAPLWDAGQLAIQFNAGPLAKPTTQAQLKTAGYKLPANLYSHIDQQQQWQTTGIAPQGVESSGWGGRVADAVNAGAGTVPPVITLAGNSIFTLGKNTRPLAVPTAGGSFGLSYANTSLQGAVAALAGQTGNTRLRNIDGQIKQSALANSALVNPIVNNATSTVRPLFAGQTSSIALQLMTVAMLIEQRAKLGLSRQVYFVSQGGYDTHGDQLNVQNTLYGQLGNALATFNNAIGSLGLGSNVTTATMSDFARTLKPNSTAGSDHAWGGHHLIMGGAVKGKQYYGRFPQHVLGGPDDTTKEGRWIPTTSVDQYVATLATWFGVTPTQLSSVVPNLASFTNAGWPASVGFMG